MTITFNPIGTIFTPFSSIEGMPIQPKGATGIKGSIEVFPQFEEGLNDLSGFSHIILLYHLHRIKNYQLSVIPFLDTVPRGVFATRAPKRPNPIGLSVVRLTEIEHLTIQIENVDILNETPLLDIKPFIPEFDQPTEFRTGWYEKAAGQVVNKRSDNRFR